MNPNELTVTGTAQTNTWFARLFGIDHFDVSAHANACSPCSSTPVDIVIAIDRTGSMCIADRTPAATAPISTTPRTACARCSGILNPPYAQIGMVAFPPVQTTATDPCAAPYNSLGGNGYDGYDSRHPRLCDRHDQRQLQDRRRCSTRPRACTCTPTTARRPRASRPAATPPTARRCARPRPSCSRTAAPNVPDYIVFLTDGEANIGSVYGANDPTYPPGNADDQQPCHTAINLANAYKAAGHDDLQHRLRARQQRQLHRRRASTRRTLERQLGRRAPPPTASCYHYASNTDESPAITSYHTLSQIASPGDFYNQPNAGQLEHDLRRASRPTSARARAASSTTTSSADVAGRLPEAGARDRYAVGHNARMAMRPRYRVRIEYCVP